MGKEFRPLSDDDFNNVNGGVQRPWLPPGQYPAQYVCYENRIDPRYGEKLIVVWRIFLSRALQNGESSILVRFYGVKRDELGQPDFGHFHGYRKDWIVANHGRPPLNWNSLPPSIFTKGLYLVTVVPVEKDSTDDLPPGLHYSKVGRIIRPIDDGERFEKLPLPNPLKKRDKSRLN